MKLKMVGITAIEYAEKHGLTLNKYADPTEDARDGLSVSEARRVATEDPSLIYLDREPWIRYDQIENLMREADAHGDHEQADVCRRALDGDEFAQATCMSIIHENEVRSSEEDA